MAWIESHQSLQRHPKAIMAAAMLRIDRHTFIGHLHCLWWWALDVADIDGNLPETVNDLVLAGAAEWTLKKSKSWLETLVSVGFLDQDGPIYRLHDWYEYAGKLNAKRAANKERMRDARAAHVQHTNGARAEHVQGLPAVPNQPNQPAEPTQPATAKAAAKPLLGLLIAFHEEHLGPVPSITRMDALKDWADRMPHGSANADKDADAIAKYAFGDAGDKGKGWPYVEAILRRYEKDGWPMEGAEQWSA